MVQDIVSFLQVPIFLFSDHKHLRKWTKSESEAALLDSLYSQSLIFSALEKWFAAYILTIFSGVYGPKTKFLVPAES